MIVYLFLRNISWIIICNDQYDTIGGCSGSFVVFIMLQLVAADKEQRFDNCGVSILTYIINLAVIAVFYCLYGGVPLFNNYKNITHDNILLHG